MNIAKWNKTSNNKLPPFSVPVFLFLEDSLEVVIACREKHMDGSWKWSWVARVVWPCQETDRKRATLCGPGALPYPSHWAHLPLLEFPPRSHGPGPRRSRVKV